MNRIYGVLLLGSIAVSGCAPCYSRPGMSSRACGPSHYYLASQPCDASGPVIISSEPSACETSRTFAPGENSDLNSLKNDVGTLQQQQQEMNRALDRLRNRDVVVPK